MRSTFLSTLLDVAKHNDKIFLLCGDLGYSVLEPFAAAFPQRFLNVGIAEQNMIAVASGLAKEGYNVFVYSLGNFPTLRCLEQIRYDVCYHNLSVKVVAVGGGYSYGPLGTSHHTTEDFGVLRTLPRMRVAAPGDPHETAAITRYYGSLAGPGYLRLNKTGEFCVHQQSLEPVGPTTYCLKKGKKTAVLANGSMLQDVFQDPRFELNQWALFSVPFVKPMDLDWLVGLAQEFEELISLEEHQLSCGFGSALAEGLMDLYSQGKISRVPRLKRVAIPDVFVEHSGSQAYLKATVGLKL